MHLRGFPVNDSLPGVSAIVKEYGKDAVQSGGQKALNKDI